MVNAPTIIVNIAVVLTIAAGYVCLCHSRETCPFAKAGSANPFHIL